MTIQEFKEHNKNHDMPYDWIGQGYGYKSEWDESKPDDIIYIPEYAYEHTEDFTGLNRTVPRNDAFSVKDFIDICDGDIKKAEKVFDVVDWQFPYSVPEEPWFEDDYEEDMENINLYQLKPGDTVLVKCKVEDVSIRGQTVTVSTINHSLRSIYIDADEIVRKV